MSAELKSSHLTLLSITGTIARRPPPCRVEVGLQQSLPKLGLEERNKNHVGHILDVPVEELMTLSFWRLTKLAIASRVAGKLTGLWQWGMNRLQRLTKEL